MKNYIHDDGINDLEQAEANLYYKVHKHYLEIVINKLEIAYTSMYFLPINKSTIYACSQVGNVYDEIFDFKNFRGLESILPHATLHLKNTFNLYFPGINISSTNEMERGHFEYKHPEDVIINFNGGALIRAKDIDDNKLKWFFLTSLKKDLIEELNKKDFPKNIMKTDFLNHILFHDYIIGHLGKELKRTESGWATAIDGIKEGLIEGLKISSKKLTGSGVNFLLGEDNPFSIALNNMMKEKKSAKKRFFGSALVSFFERNKPDAFERLKPKLTIEHLFTPSLKIDLR